MTATTSPRTVLFVCLHGAAKSVLAAVLFDRLARERGLPWRAAAGGLEPDAVVSPAAAAGLLAEGIDVREERPRAVTTADLAAAERVVSFGCDLSALAGPRAVARWDDVPAVSDGYPAARGRILEHLGRLVDDLARAQR
jgi:arsenate reductase (thioredoxin)